MDSQIVVTHLLPRFNAKNKWNNNGVVFVKADELPATIKYYLQNKPEADDIAQRGQKLLQSQREEDILEPFLRDLVHNRCPTW